jgi:hypothetical protein
MHRVWNAVNSGILACKQSHYNTCWSALHGLNIDRSLQPDPTSSRALQAITSESAHEICSEWHFIALLARLVDVLDR